MNCIAYQYTVTQDELFLYSDVTIQKAKKIYYTETQTYTNS
jgi:hypothetical protein